MIAYLEQTPGYEHPFARLLLISERESTVRWHHRIVGAFYSSSLYDVVRKDEVTFIKVNGDFISKEANKELQKVLWQIKQYKQQELL